MNITLTYATLYAKVERSLSVIGKRSKDADGNSLFSDITLGFREKEIINDYFRQAAIDLSTELATFITGGNTDSITITMPGNFNTALQPFLQESCEAYCVSYALSSWFTVTAPKLAEKYVGDCARQINAVIRLLNNKKAPTAGQQSYQDVTGEVSDIG